VNLKKRLPEMEGAFYLLIFGIQVQTLSIKEVRSLSNAPFLLLVLRRDRINPSFEQVFQIAEVGIHLPP
jgi:hypothetical protein